MSSIQYRKTRFVCVSDTHNASPDNGAFKLPKGDVLIHAGDLTKQGTYAELRKALDWIEAADFEEKIVIAGNHDITLDSEFYAEHGLYFHNQYPQDNAACKQMLADSPVTYLNHESAEITLKQSSGPGTTFKIFGSPYSPARGLWAFGYERDDALALWDQIPLDTDILLTHTPPKFHCDESRDRGAAGCEPLRQVLWRIRPQLAICGHVHEGRGAERILWDLNALNVKYKEDITGYWTDPDPDGKKQNLLDLTAKGPAPLRSAPSEHETERPTTARVASPWVRKVDDEQSSRPRNGETTTVPTIGLGGTTGTEPSLDTVALPPATRGQGGIPPSGRCDVEALTGRLGRRETCVVNAAIMASSWPYGGNKSRKYNKPFVVDVDLPLRESY